MAFNWKEYLALGESLRDNPPAGLSEASLRSAVSRAYYAAFCSARNYARDNHGFVPTGRAKDHELVRQHFHQYDPDISTALLEMRQLRNRSDYANTLHDDFPNLAGKAIGHAHFVLDNLK